MRRWLKGGIKDDKNEKVDKWGREWAFSKIWNIPYSYKVIIINLEWGHSFHIKTSLCLNFTLSHSMSRQSNSSTLSPRTRPFTQAHRFQPQHDPDHSPRHSLFQLRQLETVNRKGNYWSRPIEVEKADGGGGGTRCIILYLLIINRGDSGYEANLLTARPPQIFQGIGNISLIE